MTAYIEPFPPVFGGSFEPKLLSMTSQHTK